MTTISRRFYSTFHCYLSLTCANIRPRTVTTSPKLISTSNTPSHRALSRTLPRRQEANKSATTSSNSSPLSPASRTVTHYTLFPQTLPHGPPPDGPFPIDQPTLRREFLQLQARAHPDRHSGAADKARAEGTSALINEAYKTLSSPLLRAQYLLQMNGIDVAEDETAKVDDAELLMEVMEAREAIEEASQEGDLEELKVSNTRRLEETQKVVGKLCEGGRWDEAGLQAVRLRYWTNIKEALDDWEPGRPVVLHH